MIQEKHLPQSAADLEQIYRERFRGALDYRRRVWEQLIAGFFAQYVPENSSVLDLGCGYCEFINAVRGAKRFGMDLNPDAARHAAPGVKILSQDCSQAWAVAPDSLDVVFTSNFFEHLPTKTHLEKTLEQASIALRPGGRLIALGPNVRYLPGEYWDYYDHHIALTDRSLAEVMRKCGFVTERIIARFLPYTMSDGRRYPPVMVRAYLRLPVFWRFMGKQFLIVAAKR